MAMLVTGFGPFPYVRVNPTTSLARAVARKLVRSGLNAQALVLETSYAGGLPMLQRALAEGCPEAVLMLGVAARAHGVRVEMFARGHASRLHPDATGRAPGTGIAAPSLPLRTTGNAQGALAALRRRGIRAWLSASAGRYLCDASYATALRATAASQVPVLFIHVPWLRPGAGARPCTRVAAYRPAAAPLEAALCDIARLLARSGRRNRAITAPPGWHGA